MKIAILDDHQGVALDLADWASLAAEIEVFTEHVGDPDELVRRLAGHDVVVAMRERTPFRPRCSNGCRICGCWSPSVRRTPRSTTRRPGSSASRCAALATSPHTSEHTWALILAVCRNLPARPRPRPCAVAAAEQHRARPARAHAGPARAGRLGSAVARIGQAFGMITIASRSVATGESTPPS